MLEAIKLLAVMCVWAVVCRLGMNLLPRGPWPIGIYAIVCLLAVTWIVPMAMFDLKSANAMLKTTFMWWAGTAVVAMLVVFTIG